MAFAAWLTAWLVTGACSPAFAGVAATVKATGVYGENQSSAAKGMACAGVHAKLLQAGDTAPAQMLARFGLELLVEGGKQGGPARLDVVLEHPPLRQPGKAEPVTSRSWEVPACVGMPVLVAWTFLSEWELVPGEWTFRISHGGQELATRTFKVVQGALPEPEAQLSISLTPKAPTAPVALATPGAPGNTTAPGMLTPEEGIAALASMRGIEPTVAAMALDLAEAKRLASQSSSLGLPALVKPVQAASGAWHAVVVWDFTQKSSDEPQPARADPKQKGKPAQLVPALAVQLATYTDMLEAQTYAASLLQYGLQVYIESLQADGRVLHTVRVGPFDATRSGRDQALRIMDKLHARGVRIPLLTRTPEPLSHASAEVVQAVKAAPEPAAPALPQGLHGQDMLKLHSMDSAKAKLDSLLELARPDERILEATTKHDEERNQPAPDEEDEPGREDDATGRDNPQRRPRNTPAVEEFAKAAARGASTAMRVQIGPFAKRGDAEQFQKRIAAARAGNDTVAATAPTVTVVELGQGFCVQAGGFANAQTAKRAGVEWIAAHAPDAGLSAMVVASETKPQPPSRRSRTPEPTSAGNATGNMTGNATAGAPPAAPTARYSLQLASTASKDEAARQTESWKAKGLSARVVELPGALGRVYSVRAGDYASMAAAQAAAQGVQAAHGQLPLVVEEQRPRKE